MARATTRTGTTTTTVARVVLAATALLAAVTACGPVNAGTSAAEDAEGWFTDVPGVESVDASGSDPLPWSGDMSAVVHLSADATHDDVLAAARRAAEFERGGVTDSFTLEQPVAGASTRVRVAAGLDATLLDYRDDLAAAVGTGELSLVTDVGGSARPPTPAQPGAATRRVDLVVRTADDVAAALPAARAAAAVTPPAGTVLVRLAAAVPGDGTATLITATEDALDGLDVLPALVEHGVPVERVDLGTTTVALTVPAGEGDRARAAAGRIDLGHRTVTVTESGQPARHPGGTAPSAGPAGTPSAG